MEIVSSCNHRYTPDTEWERKRKRERERERKNSLGAYRFECAPRQGKRNIGTRDQTWEIRVFFLPVAQQHRIRETVLLADVTVRFSDAACRCNESRDKNPDLQPRFIVARIDHFFDRLASRSSIYIIIAVAGMKILLSISILNIVKKAQFYFWISIFH